MKIRKINRFTSYAATLKLFAATVVTCLALYACNPQPEALSLLREAQRLAENRPDSAMLLINSISNPEKSLEREQYMHYLVALVQVRYKNYRDISADTLVFDAARYFARRDKDPRQTAQAYFYGGCVLREQKRYGPAMQYYKQAETFALKAKDKELQGLTHYNMGDLLAGQGLYSAALDNYKISAGLYNGLPDKQAYSFAAAGRMFMLEKKQDSAFYYFHRGLDEAARTDDKALQSLLEQNLSVAYQEAGKYKEAEKYLRQSFKNNNAWVGQPRYYLNFAELYGHMEMPDSTALYIGKLKKSIDSLDNSTFKASAYRFLAAEEKQRKQYDTAFAYQDKYTRIIEDITNARLQQSVYEVQQKYNNEREKNLHQQSLNRYQHWIILLLLAIIVGGTVFTWYTIRQKNKLLGVRQHIDTLHQMAEKLKKSHRNEMSIKNKNLRDLLLWKFDVVKKASLLGGEEMNDKNASALIKRFRQIVYDDDVNDQWSSILSVFDEVNNRLAEKINRLFPELTEPEYKITLLTYAGMSIKEISVILHLSPNTVQTYRTSIRKKLGIADTSDIGIHVKNMFDE